MKMFLTRIGFNSRVVVNGDITQIDLPAGKRSGLKDAIQILEHVDGIASVFLTSADVVRHELVQRIINAYDKHNAARAAQPKPSPAPPAKHTFRRTR